MKKELILIILLIAIAICNAQTPKMIVLTGEPIWADTLTAKKIYYYKMFRVILIKDSVIVKAGRKTRSIFINENDRKLVLERLKK